MPRVLYIYCSELSRAEHTACFELLIQWNSFQEYDCRMGSTKSIFATIFFLSQKDVSVT